jgi:class 3 adenylate cyclase
MASGYLLPRFTGRTPVVILPGLDGAPAAERPRRAAPGPPAAAGARFLASVLITDIVDSTGTVARLGDRRWRDLLAAHYADCGIEIEAAGGEIVETTGDGVIAIFGSPAHAVRAGMAIAAGAQHRGIAIRAGVHTGECERMGDGIVGLSVHIAARVCALGRADEVMTTAIVRELVLGSLLEFEARGVRELRGVPGDWAIFRATEGIAAAVEASAPCRAA